MKFQQMAHKYNLFQKYSKFFRMLPHLRDKKNILFIELNVKETSGAHLNRIPLARLSPSSPLLCPGGYREQKKVILWSCELQGLQVERLPAPPLPVQASAGGSHTLPGSLQIACSQSQCWCFMVHKLHGQQALQDSNAYLLAGGDNPPELCCYGPS